MNDTISRGLRGSVVEEDVELTTFQLSRACRTSEHEIELWVVEGVLQPRGATRASWRFSGDSLARMRLASRLARDLEINTQGVALALDLLDRIADLEARLAR
jgi:chaperone modulatory protein CbpM